jgi:ribosomal protein L7/L12
MKLELTVSELRDMVQPGVDIQTTMGIRPSETKEYFKRPAGSDVVPCVVDEIIFYLYRGEKINAIKRYKERYSVGLKEAKDAIDDFDVTLGKIFP